MKTKLVKNFSIKHILNKNLKAIDDPGDDTIKLYPVYVQIIYKRIKYVFKSIIKTYYTDLENTREDDNELMEFEKDFLVQIFKFELEQKHDNMDLPGFANRYEKYRRSVISEAENFLISKIEHVLRSEKCKYQDIFNYRYETGKFNLLLEAVRILVPEVGGNREFKTCELAEEMCGYYKKVFPENKKFDLVMPFLFNWFSEGHKIIMYKYIDEYFSGDNAILSLNYINEFDFLMRVQIFGI